MIIFVLEQTQQTNTCSKSAVEALEKVMKYIQLWTSVTPFHSVSIVDFE